jgi:hypothetical protein
MLHKRDLIAIALLIALALAIACPRFRSGLDIRDEGFLAYGAERVAQGQIPNRDFESLQPPGSFYTAAAIFKLFGTSLVSLRIFGLTLYVTIPILAYAIIRRMTGPVLAFAGAIPTLILGIPYFNFVPFAVWQGITATTAAALLILLATDYGRPRLALLSGIFTGASLLLRQDQGVYLIISIVAYIAILRKIAVDPASKSSTTKLALGWIVGIALVLLPCAILWAVEGALPAMFRQLVLAPLTTYAKTSSAPFPRFSLLTSPAQDVLINLFYCVPFVVILCVIGLRRQVRKRGWSLRETRLAFATIWSALFFCQAITRSDLSHLLITLVPFFVMCAWAWNALHAGLAWHISNACAVAALLWTAAPAVFPETAGEQKVDLPRAGVFAKGGAALAAFVRSVQSQVPPNRPILCLPYQPMLYFLSQRRNPTRWNYLWPGDQSPEDHQTLIDEARHDPPTLVFIVEENQLRLYAPAIVDYFNVNYKKTAQVGTMSVYAPK